MITFQPIKRWINAMHVMAQNMRHLDRCLNRPTMPYCCIDNVVLRWPFWPKKPANDQVL